MNQQQIKYARQRLENLYGQKRAAIREKYVVKPLSLTEKVDAIKKGNYRVDDRYLDKNYYNLDNVIVFTEKRTVDQIGLDKELAKLTEAYTRSLDELLLGDNEKALELIKSFEAI